MSAGSMLPEKALPPKEFCQFLINEVKNHHARLHHPFYLAFYDGRISMDEIRIWAKVAWGNFLSMWQSIRQSWCAASSLESTIRLFRRILSISSCRRSVTTYSKGPLGQCRDTGPSFFGLARGLAFPEKSLSGAIGKTIFSRRRSWPGPAGSTSPFGAILSWSRWPRDQLLQ